jgi:prevent-host-death family protein
VRKINVAEDIVPIGEFKTHASEFIRKMHETGRPMVITQNGRPAAVMLTPDEYTEFDYAEFVRQKVRAGIESAEQGRSRPLGAVVKSLRSRIAKAKKTARAR